MSPGMSFHVNADKTSTRDENNNLQEAMTAAVVWIGSADWMGWMAFVAVQGTMDMPIAPVTVNQPTV